MPDSTPANTGPDPQQNTHAVPAGNKPTRTITKNVSTKSATVSPPESTHRNHLNSTDTAATALTSRCRTTTAKKSQIIAIAYKLNHRPRKTHGYRTSAEVYAGLLNSGDALTA
ncbi:hypothetical protein ACFVT1_38225 [Streptomyces sp. NPDC057963]|uniref:hypothetical protein n=1 Tax=Streptomyces sp. NPDC057963 TaxID=3346290 RepID=UPI0036E18195